MCPRKVPVDVLLPNKIKTLAGTFCDGKAQGLRSKVALWRGDITKLRFDAIVNAANKSLLGGGGVDGAIHAAAGPSLLEECKELEGCKTGEAKITAGYNLPSAHVIHTVGPIGEDAKKLTKCYANSLNLLLDNKLRTIAFPCISTGIYGYPNDAAAHVALKTTKKWLDSNHKNVDLVVFCLFMKVDVEIYHKLANKYFSQSEESDPAPREQAPAQRKKAANSGSKDNGSSANNAARSSETEESGTLSVSEKADQINTAKRVASGPADLPSASKEDPCEPMDVAMSETTEKDDKSESLTPEMGEQTSMSEGQPDSPKPVAKDVDSQNVMSQEMCDDGGAESQKPVSTEEGSQETCEDGGSESQKPMSTEEAGSTKKGKVDKLLQSGDGTMLMSQDIDCDEGKEK